MRFALTAARRTALASRQATKVSPPRMVVRGMAGSSVHGENPDRIAKEKARNLKGEQHSSAPHKEHAPGWNEHLASESEANVKADQAAPEKPSKNLQEQTIKQTHEHHHGEGGEKGAPPAPSHSAPGTHSEETVRADQAAFGKK